MIQICHFCDIGHIADKQLGEKHRLEREATDLMAEVAGVIIQRYEWMADIGGPRPFDGLIEVLQTEIIKQMEWEPSKGKAAPPDLHPMSIMRMWPRERTPRQRISHGKVMRVYARDQFKCIICGSSRDLTVDHVWPLIRGGTNDETNLASMCSKHNSAKSDLPLEEFIRILKPHEKRYYNQTRAALTRHVPAGPLVVWKAENHHLIKTK